MFCIVISNYGQFLIVCGFGSSTTQKISVNFTNTWNFLKIFLNPRREELFLTEEEAPQRQQQHRQQHNSNQNTMKKDYINKEVENAGEHQHRRIREQPRRETRRERAI